MKEFLGIKLESKMIRIRVSDTCNQNCSYCKEHDLSPIKFITKENFTILLNNIKLIHNNENRKINLFLYGGEPLLNKNLWNFILDCRSTEFKNIINEISIHTNLNLNITDEQFKIFKDYRVKVSSSIHLEYKNNFPRIFNNFRNILKNNIEFEEINLMLDKIKDYSEILNIEKNNKDLPICIVPTFQLIENEYPKLKFLLRKEMKNKNIPDHNGGINYINIHKFYNPKNWKCNVPIDCFEIDSDGQIYWCHEDYMNKIKAGINFFQTIDPNLFNKSIICKHSRCNCEHYVYKEKNYDM